MGKFVGTPLVRRPRWVNIVLRCRGNSVRRKALQPRRQTYFPYLCRRQYLRLANPSSRLGNLQGNPISSSIGSNSSLDTRLTSIWEPFFDQFPEKKPETVSGDSCPHLHLVV
ncbi:hypothetical protein L484_019917 [Morus notabilis]|uniref:Uncharacterized protein n=1 Tax=Morus notabilis TaxID=981085 RepID=W9QV34_9ROSA|nr:hypothetical protein L484_019917 [Morus notabilis]